MALVVNDRVKETSTTTGTGTLSLAGAVTGFETFVAGIGTTNTTYYAIVNTNNGEFEVGLGTVTDATPDTLSRDTIISSSNSDSAVDFSAGTKNVFCTLPASKAVILDASGNIVANNGSNLTNLNASNLASGTVPDARFPATLPAADGSALTALNATQLTSGTVPDARFPSTLPALNGSALTNLNASNLASGTVANARLDAQLQDVAGLATTSGKIIQGDGSNFILSAFTLPTADGSANQVLQTDGAGAVTFATISADITGVTAGSGLTGGGTSGDVTLNVGAGNLIDVQADQIDVDLSELTTSTSNADGDFFVVVDSANAQKKLTKANIAISGFNNDSGFTTNTGTVTSVSGGNGLTGSVTTSGSLAVGAGTAIDVSADAVSVDLSELSTSTTNGDGDFFVVVDSANAQRKLTKGNINISGFNNDAGYTSNTGDITGVTAGNGLTGGGSSGSVTLNIGAGTGIDVAADSISVDVSDFMSNGANDRVLTATGTDAFKGEDQLTFNGTDLGIPQNIFHQGDTNCYFGFHATDQWRVVTGGTERFEVNSSNITAARHFVPGANDTYDLGASGNVWRNLYTGDLHLSNEAKDEGNAIDGTKGNWTIQEGAEHLYILNNKSGKKYRFKLEEM